MSEEWNRETAAGWEIWTHGRRAGTRDVVARMPASSISRLLLFVWICAVREALAKSLPDQGAFGKLAIRGDAAQWGDGSGCIFMAFGEKKTIGSLHRCTLICSLKRRWILRGGFSHRIRLIMLVWWHIDPLISAWWATLGCVCAVILFRCVVWDLCWRP